MTVIALGAWPAAALADDSSVLAIELPTPIVSPGQAFVVNITQSTPVTTTGAQATLAFPEKLIQLQDFELGPAYTAANAIFAFGNADKGTQADKALAIADANKTGKLENVAGFLLPGGGTIPAGDNLFLKLTFAPLGVDGGKDTLLIQNGAMIDEQGVSLEPITKVATLTIEAGEAPSGSLAPPSGEPGASPQASEAPTEPPVLANATTPIKVSLAPTSLDLKTGDTARIFLIANANGNLSSAVADFTFDPAKLEITAVEIGAPWAGAIPVAVAADPTERGIDGAIKEANTTGLLPGVGAFFAPNTGDLPYGEGSFVSVLVKAKADGTSTMSIGNAAALGINGEDLPVEIDAASLTKPPEKGIELDPTIVVPLLVLVVAIIVFLALLRTGRIPERTRRRWPYYVSMLLGLVPVALFVAMFAALIVNAAPVVTDPGIGALFGGKYKDFRGNTILGGFPLLPAIWGTVVITTIAALVALPLSLALAVTAVDFPMGRLGRLIRPVISLLSGVPPIVYAVSVPGFVAVIMIPKFAANMVYDQFEQGGPAAIGADPATWAPAGVPYSAGAFPWEWLGGNSALLAGLLVGLFLIPFVAPLFVDALANVPRAAREGSLALGANVTYTLRRVVLPRAMPAIAGAATLGILKAMGDSVIVLFAVGTVASTASPPFDVLERLAGLGAWGASLIGSFEVLDQNCTAQACAVGYTSALLLLVIASFVVVVMSVLQARGRRRVAT